MKGAIVIAAVIAAVALSACRREARHEPMKLGADVPADGDAAGSGPAATATARADAPGHGAPRPAPNERATAAVEPACAFAGRLIVFVAYSGLRKCSHACVHIGGGPYDIDPALSP